MLNRFLQLFCCRAYAAAADGKARASRSSRGRTRAMDGEDKEARRQDILNAAERLYAQHREFASAADIADAAGLAKGTVYLYFGTKEEIYLALHLRNMSAFFDTLLRRLQRVETPLTIREMRELTRRYIIDPPDILPLGVSCVGALPHTTSPDAALAFQSRMTDWLLQAGEQLERHFPRIAPGYGPALLKQSYAIVLGLYSLSGPEGAPNPRCPDVPGMGRFADEVELMLTRYWAQVAGTEDDLSSGLPPLPQSPKPPRRAPPPA